MNPNQLSISWGALWKILAMFAFVSVVYLSREVVLAIVIAIVIATSLEPFVTWLQKRRIPRLIGTLAVYIVVLFVIAVVLYIVVPIFLTQLNSILENSQDIFGNLIESLGIESSVLQTIIGAINEFTGSLLGGQTTLVSFLSQILGGLLLSIIVFVISFYLTIGRDSVERFMKAILPRQYHATVLVVYQRIQKKISNWFTGQLILSVIMGVLTFTVLSILGVKYAFVLAIAAAAFELVPYVGPIFAGSLAVLTAFTQSATLGVYALGMFIIIHQLESHVIFPLVNKYTTNLNPVIAIVSLLIGGKILGVAGIIIAVPLAVLFQEIVSHWTGAREPANELASTI